ncbi:MAG: hypothetical protein HYV08_11430 [Deltaproteobacteria bacterium]|nr:hypothetical protein [Deltaproteobacteria bacterium]MBI3077182.1 hypothetical protein [Deltaproteobacteria bacterium]
MAEKQFDIDDPMEMVGVLVPDGDPELLAECMVEEYVRTGMGDEEILRLFTHPCYTGTHAIYRSRGEAYVRDLLARARARWGRPRFATEE